MIFFIRNKFCQQNKQLRQTFSDKRDACEIAENGVGELLTFSMDFNRMRLLICIIHRSYIPAAEDGKKGRSLKNRPRDVGGKRYISSSCVPSARNL